MDVSTSGDTQFMTLETARFSSLAGDALSAGIPEV
jgi:hypothetical protein